MLPEKEGFRKRFSAILGEKGYQEFMDYNSRWLRRSIRVNTLKMGVAECKKRLNKWALEPVAWCKEGFFVKHKTEDRIDIGNTAEHMMGYYYVQEAASMLPPLVLGPKPGEFVLDMCAAPGSKTTQIAAMMKNKGVLVANDYKGSRLAALGINLQKCGLTNNMITLMEGHWFRGERFDRVLVDAPCSGTGSIRKSYKTLEIWNPEAIKRLSGQQKNLIKSGFRVVKPGGLLVYSTCSVEPEENECVVDFLLGMFPNAAVEDIKINIKRSEPILSFEGKSYNPQVKKTLRIWPQDNDTGGFFVAKIRKALP